MEGGSRAEAELRAVEQERQNSRLWRNGEDGGRCLGHFGISVCPAAAFRADLKGNCYMVYVGCDRSTKSYFRVARTLHPKDVAQSPACSTADNRMLVQAHGSYSVREGCL
jgi:hypothetical protein